MIQLKCPKCQSNIEIDDKKMQEMGVTAVFCSNEDCTFNKNPLIGINRHDNEVWISESII
jgi:hypothetical protein